MRKRGRVEVLKLLELDPGLPNDLATALGCLAKSRVRNSHSGCHADERDAEFMRTEVCDDGSRIAFHTTAPALFDPGNIGAEFVTDVADQTVQVPATPAR